MGACTSIQPHTNKNTIPNPKSSSNSSSFALDESKLKANKDFDIAKEKFALQLDNDNNLKPEPDKNKKHGHKRSFSAAAALQYEVQEFLGSGHFAQVFAVKDRLTDVRYALKIIDKKNLSEKNAYRSEVAILVKIGTHPNVTALKDYFEDDDDFCIIMELCEGGDLFSNIIKNGHYNEARAIEILRQLASAIKHLHKNGVTHRDLKPENIMFLNKDPHSPVKVGDFGLSSLIKSNSENFMKTVCGTWAYTAPEVIRKERYTSAVDVWTLGVLMYILLCGFHPFDVYGNAPEPVLLRNILDCKYDFDDDIWDNASKDAKGIIRKLLQVRPEKRMTLDEFLEHPYISVKPAASATKSRNKIVEGLIQYTTSRRQGRAGSLHVKYNDIHSPDISKMKKKDFGFPLSPDMGKDSLKPSVEIFNPKYTIKQLENNISSGIIREEDEEKIVD